MLERKDRMKTETAKQIAEERHAFMEDFLIQFFNEWEGQIEELVKKPAADSWFLFYRLLKSPIFVTIQSVSPKYVSVS